MSEGEDHVSDDMGFDDVIAGNVYKPPDEPAVTAAVSERLHPTMSPNADTASPPAPAPLPPVGLTEDGVQAAKALVHLPATLDTVSLAKLAREIAMDIKERHAILKDHGLTQAQYDFLEAHNVFYKHALEQACAEWHAPLTTVERVKMASAAILEDSLPGLGARMQNKGEGLPGVVEAAKFFQKLSGIGERETSGANAGERFVINIDLGRDEKITVSTEDVEAPPLERTQSSSLSTITQTQNSPLALRQEPEREREQSSLPPFSPGT